MTAIVVKLVLLVSAMMTTTRIVAIVVSSVQPVAPALVEDMAYLLHISFFQLAA